MEVHPSSVRIVTSLENIWKKWLSIFYKQLLADGWRDVPGLPEGSQLLFQPTVLVVTLYTNIDGPNKQWKP